MQNGLNQKNREQRANETTDTRSQKCIHIYLQHKKWIIQRTEAPTLQ